MDKLWKAAGAAAWGAASLSGLRAFMGEGVAEKLCALCPNPKTVLVGAFPYYAGEGEGNLSLYCRGEDYHRVLVRRLETVCEGLRNAHPGFSFLPGADNSPIPELAAAELAGVGVRGRHGLRIVSPYGSYVFLGTILTDWETAQTGPAAKTLCPENCTACRDACPTGALGEGGCDISRCLSELTQKKGELSPEEERAIRKGGLIWGCDCCQKACPYNKKAAMTPLPEFRENLLPSLTLGELEGMSNKGFRKQYADKAFSWRGIAPLRRNLQLKASENASTQD